MNISDTGLGQIKHREGVVLTMYRDSAGLPTIGVGHLLTRDELRSGKLTGFGYAWHQGLTAAQVDELLKHDLAWAEAAVAGVTVPLTAHQYDALVSFAFNVGAHAFRRSTLFALLNGGHYTAVPAQMRKWIHSAGEVDPILVDRREEEVAQWLA